VILILSGGADSMGCLFWLKKAWAVTLVSDDKNNIPLQVAYNVAFLFYEIKFLSLDDDKNFISFPFVTRTLSLSRLDLLAGYWDQLQNFHY
jgi:hypothetical protein